MVKYLVMFSVVYFLALIASLMISTYIDIGAVSTVVTLLLSSMLSGLVFVNDHGRVPSKSEKRVLVWGSLLVTILISSLLAIIYLTVSGQWQVIVQELRPVPIWVWIVSAMVVSLVYLLFLSFCFGPLLKRFSNR